MNSLPSLIINTRNNNKRASLPMPAQSNSFIKSFPISNDYFVKFCTSNHCSMFDEQINCINQHYNQRKDDHQYRRSVVITNTSSNFRSAIPANNHYQYMKRYQYRRYISNLPSSKQRMMIGVDHNHTIGLMQSQEQKLMSSSPVIPESNSHQKKFLSSSSQIRLALRCSCPIDNKHEKLFDEVFSHNEQTTNISECILSECLLRLTNNNSNTLIILSGYYREVHHIQTDVLSSTVIRLYNFVQEKDLILRIHVQELLNNKTLSSDNYFVSSPTETSDYLINLCLNHRFNPLLIKFYLENHSNNSTYGLLNILLTNDNDNETTKEHFTDSLMSLALSYSSTRQKQKKRNLTTETIFSSLLNEYIFNNQSSKYFLYIFANVKHEKQVKYWTKIQRLFQTKKNRLKMSRDRFDSSMEREIWIDGPLSSPNPKKEVWIDGPPEFCSHKKTRSSILSPKHSTILHKNPSECSPSKTFDTESIISSHCHLPVLPVFKDHSLLPFRSNQTLPRTKPLVMNSSKIDLRLSTNKLNDDMELLEKTLETLLIPSPIVPTNHDKTQSLNRIDQLSLSMTNDEKTKRLSRIVSPTRFDKLFTNNQSRENLNWYHLPSTGSSVPNSPLIKSRNHQSRMQTNSISSTPHHSLTSTKKSKILPETTRPTTRPSIFQRLFGSRSSSTPQQPIPIIIQSPPSSPLISPLTVTLDSHDDLMPLTTSSTTSSASGRASSSGYESMSNTVLEEMIASIPTMIANENNIIKLRNKPLRKDERCSNTNVLWNSPNLRDKSHRQQRISQLKHRENELKLELAVTKTFLLMDKNKNFDQNDSLHSLINNNSMHINEEDELEKEINHLERRLASAKSQLHLKKINNSTLRMI